MNDEDIIEAAIKAAETMIADAKKRSAIAVKREDWARAALESAYVDGMEQILVIFKLALDKE